MLDSRDGIRHASHCARTFHTSSSCGGSVRHEVEWHSGTTYMNRFLPFGLHSAPKIFTAVADAIQWVLFSHGVTQCLHYLDDFIILVHLLGIEVNTQSMQLHLPEEKLSRLAAELGQAVGRKVMFKKELQSLTGLLQHATKVVREACMFCSQ